MPQFMLLQLEWVLADIWMLSPVVIQLVHKLYHKEGNQNAIIWLILSTHAIQHHNLLQATAQAVNAQGSDKDL